jgi:hypothetical protein
VADDLAKRVFMDKVNFWPSYNFSIM